VAPMLRWPPVEVEALRARLDELEAIVRTPSPELSQEARDWLARLLVVRSCGFVEQVVVSVARGYVHGSSGGRVRAFSESWLQQSRLPTPEALSEIAGRFDGSWADELLLVLLENDEHLHREMYFLVDRRNKIAHGLSEGVGTVKALALKEVACVVADWFVLRFNPVPGLPGVSH
jgi:hypothetical protein